MLVIRRMMRRECEGESRIVAAVSARRKGLTFYHRDLMLVLMHAIVYDVINSRFGAEIARFKLFHKCRLSGLSNAHQTARTIVFRFVGLRRMKSAAQSIVVNVSPPIGYRRAGDSEREAIQNEDFVIWHRRTDAAAGAAMPSADAPPAEGKWVVLYFYPKDMTPGCTIEAHNFQRDQPEFDLKNAVILVVSLHSVDSHVQFRTRKI